MEEEPTPVIFDEFRLCSSEYMISDKDSESAISSDGEFIDAGKINVYDEDDSYIDKIEKIKEKQFLRDSIYQGLPQPGGRFQSLKTFQSQSLKRVNQKEPPL